MRVAWAGLPSEPNSGLSKSAESLRFKARTRAFQEWMASDLSGRDLPAGRPGYRRGR